MARAVSDGSDHTNDAVSADELIKQPWTLWNKKSQCESLLKNKLLESFKGAVLLKRRKTHITDEIGKKRSRRGAAVKRALAAAKSDAKRVYSSATGLGLDELWTYLESEISSDIKPLTKRLEAILDTQPNRILKHEYPEAAARNDITTYHNSDDEADERVANKGQEEMHESASQSSDDNGTDDNYDGRSDDYSDNGSEGDWEESAGDQYDSSDDRDANDDIDESESDANSDDETVVETEAVKKQNKVTKDPFFKMEEMEEFADQDFDEEDDFNYFESLGEESDTSKPAVDMMYDDFFREPDEDDDDDGEVLHCTRDLEGLDDDEREMELLLQKVENELPSDEDDSERDEDELVDFDRIHAAEDEPQNTEQDSAEEDDQISKVEKDLIAQKHWSLMGEATARKRPRNSLLDLDLELPQNSSFIHAEYTGEVDGTTEDDNMGLEENQDVPVEIIIQQRIKAEVFDNVERKVALEDQLEAIERLKQKRNKMNLEGGEIDFNKSKLGLGDVYAKRYQEMFMATDQLDSHKQKLTEDFGKLMFKLDSLCNYHMVPKRVSEAEKTKNVASITVEAPINVVTASSHNDLQDKMEGNKITRNAKKRKFTNKLKALLKSGRATVEDVKKIKQSMMERNRQKIQDVRTIKATGQTKDGENRAKRSNRRVNIAELMSKDS
ncbi:U3 small nucleolar ribonucleoprotein MPP10 [Babesia sp. Xinjiang]|uniref:U3 small nucleolar ribonucleoprotein MPP10 n=1 Tax=Babesia sp. Xinjiang TaxID=462227 RepID=UPI000A22B4A8|nr:U3 small nucleolar ribonucleoprotein MPP10 [Babesia sp. Xinjiang]ORM40614.1 U3 small nucleolar ribonucleoprotein MPP10 [Babesia sp. Xinjiang]